MPGDEEPSAAFSRLVLSAATFDPARALATMKPVWDTPTSTTKAVRACIWSDVSAALLAYRVKRRYRQSLRDELGSVESEGYMLGRYLLGTAAAKPQYSDTEADVADHARAIGRRSGDYDFDLVIGAIDTGNRVVIEDALRMSERNPLVGLLGERIGRATFLTMYCTGISTAVAEEELFGPLA